jgi:hypothetical protein
MVRPESPEVGNGADLLGLRQREREREEEVNQLAMIVTLALLVTGCDWLRRQAKTHEPPRVPVKFWCYHSDGTAEEMKPDQHTCDTGTWSSGGTGPSCEDQNVKRTQLGLEPLKCGEK